MMYFFPELLDKRKCISNIVVQWHFQIKFAFADLWKWLGINKKISYLKNIFSDREITKRCRKDVFRIILFLYAKIALKEEMDIEIIIKLYKLFLLTSFGFGLGFW